MLEDLSGPGSIYERNGQANVQVRTLLKTQTSVNGQCSAIETVLEKGERGVRYCPSEFGSRVEISKVDEIEMFCMGPHLQL